MPTMLTDILAVEPEGFLLIIFNWLVFKDDDACINPVFLRCQHWFGDLQLTSKFIRTILLSKAFIKFHFMLSRPQLYPTVQSIDDNSHSKEFANVTDDGTYICSLTNCSDFKTDTFSFNATVPDLNNNGLLKHISHDMVELNLPLGQPVVMSNWLKEPWNEYFYDYVHKFSTNDGPKEHNGPLKCTSRYFPNCTDFVLLVFRTDETLPYSVDESSFYSFAYCLFPCKPNGMIPAYTGVYDIIRDISYNDMVMVNYIRFATTSHNMEFPLNIENRDCLSPNCFTIPYINTRCFFQMLPCCGTHLCPCAGCFFIQDAVTTDEEMVDSD